MWNWILSFFKEEETTIPVSFVPPPESPKLPVEPILPQKPLYIPQDLSKWKLTPILEPLAQEFLYQAKCAGYEVKITQGFRSPEYQDALYAQGRTTPGKIVTRTTSKQSYHCKGQAFDICFVNQPIYPSDDRIWKALADIAKSVGLIPGYYFKGFQDKDHYEIH